MRRFSRAAKTTALNALNVVNTNISDDSYDSDDKVIDNNDDYDNTESSEDNNSDEEEITSPSSNENWPKREIIFTNTIPFHYDSAYMTPLDEEFKPHKYFEHLFVPQLRKHC